jgi:membrane protein
MPARILRATCALFAETVRGWSRRNPDLLSAALAFNTLFSLAPLLLLFITIAGEQYRSQVVGQIFMAVDRWGGPAIAGLVADLLAGMQRASAGPLVTIATAVILAWSASGMVLRLRFALNTMWDLVPVEAPNVKRGVLVTLTGRLISVGILLVIGFALLALLILNTLDMTLFSIQLQDLIPRLGEAASPVPPWFSFLLYFFIFAVTLKLLPQGNIRWRDLWPGALLTTALFWLGNFVIKFYISVVFVTSLHGVVASTIVFMLWVYYSAMIVLFGARFTYVYTERYGKPVAPGRNMRQA